MLMVKELIESLKIKQCKYIIMFSLFTSMYTYKLIVYILIDLFTKTSYLPNFLKFYLKSTLYFDTSIFLFFYCLNIIIP